jgi:hypothetical protein
LLVQKQIYVGKLDGSDVADGRGPASQRVHPEALMLSHARDVEMIVADDDGRIAVHELRGTGHSH